ncbi:hypothetical protein GJ744_009145 [Endocarpon pusillum]|uniref:Uncharacterized protein n=1 Tax=Endocarpon pusillum TaxID=364733 RepID=A0A8H7AKB5_9EURO|nr:hypothetical protein GJ744_009145 [Endocarpon pusillum]
MRRYVLAIDLADTTANILCWLVHENKESTCEVLYHLLRLPFTHRRSNRAGRKGPAMESLYSTCPRKEWTSEVSTDRKGDA